MENIVNIEGRAFRLDRVEATRNSGGRLSKIWITDVSDNRYLVKSSTLFNKEPYSEVMAYHIGRVLGFNVLEYRLISAEYFKDVLPRGIKCKHVSVCRDINSQGCDLVTITNLKNQLNLMSGVKYSNQDVMEKYLSKEYIDRMLFFDAIIGNKDRHYRNIHIFKDNYGNTFEAPIIDNGDSLLATDVIGGIHIVGSYLANKYNKSCTLYNNHDKQMEYITTINTIGVDTDALVRKCIAEITPTLKLLGRVRAQEIVTYLSYRIYKYYNWFR